MSDTLWPNVFGFAMVSVILLVTLFIAPVRLAYQVASRLEDSAGAPQRWSFCGSATKPEPGSHTLATGGFQEFGYYPHKICHPTGIELQEGRRYAIQIAIPVDLKNDPNYEDAGSCRPGNERADAGKLGTWHDGSIEVTSTAGISSTPKMALFLPFRRIWSVNWFVPIAAIGTRVPERHYLTEPTTGFTATRTGLLSLYVNDAAFPGAPDDDRGVLDWDDYYDNNTGGPARVRITELDATASVESLPALKPISCTEQRAMWARWIAPAKITSAAPR